jgi:hypothetical protein
MLDQIVQEIVQRTGIPEELARQAATIAIAALKERLPPPLAAQVDVVLGGGDIAQGLLGGLGGLLGGQQKE